MGGSSQMYRILLSNFNNTQFGLQSKIKFLQLPPTTDPVTPSMTFRNQLRKVCLRIQKLQQTLQGYSHKINERII